MKRHMFSTLAIAALAGVLYVPVDAIRFCYLKLKEALA